MRFSKIKDPIIFDGKPECYYYLFCAVEFDNYKMLLFFFFFFSDPKHVSEMSHKEAMATS